jgi:hypothetical protein
MGRSMLIVCVLGLGMGPIGGCGGETGGGDRPQRSDRGTGGSADLGGPAQQDSGVPAYLDGGAPPPAPDAGAVQSNGPPAAQITGSYQGTYKGTVTAGLPFNLTGNLSFTLVAGASPDEYTIQNGKLQGAVLGLSYTLPMQGKVVCGKLDGAGTGDVSGVKLQGTYKATWVPGGFPTGSWSGQDVDKKANGSGTWEAKRK